MEVKSAFTSNGPLITRRWILRPRFFLAQDQVVKETPPFPPGPPAEPIIGHLRLIPPNNDRPRFFYELGRKYGKCVDGLEKRQLTAYVGRRYRTLEDPRSKLGRYKQQ